MQAKAYLIDRDGVLNRAKGEEPFPEAREWLRRLARKRVPFLIATNHSTSSPADAVAKLQARGFPVEPEHLHCPVNLLLEWIEEHCTGRIYARGAPELLSFLKTRSVALTDGPRADTVLLAFDRSMSYEALSTAIEAVLDHGARLLAMHENRIFRSGAGRVEPGLGAWVRAVEFATGRKALVLGKPSLAYYRSALEKLGSLPEETLIVSDDPLGDLAGAKEAGLFTVFVTSGKYGRSVLESPALKHKPDLVLESIDELVLPS